MDKDSEIRILELQIEVLKLQKEIEELRKENRNNYYPIVVPQPYYPYDGTWIYDSASTTSDDGNYRML